MVRFKGALTFNQSSSSGSAYTGASHILQITLERELRLNFFRE